MSAPRFPRPGMRRVVVVVPSLFTLFNLFFGFWSMVLASRGEFYRAGWFIVFAGILDVLDGRVARLSGTGNEVRRRAGQFGGHRQLRGGAGVSDVPGRVFPVVAPWGG